MKCKYCEAELEEGVTLCPGCGKDNSGAPEEVAFEIVATEGTLPETEAPAQAPEIKEGAKLSSGKLALTIAACVVLLAVLVALILGGLSAPDSTGETEDTTTAATGETQLETQPAATVPEGTGLNDPTCKGTYTVSDEEVKAAADAVIATMGEDQLTNAQLQVYYGLMVNQFLSSEDFYYLYYYGEFDYTQPLDTQYCYYDTTLTWQQYFLQEALSAWQCYQSLAREAKAAGFEMPTKYREYLDSLPATMESDAISGGFADAQEMVEYNLGACVTVEDYLAFQETYYLGYSYYLSLSEQIQPTDAEVEAYFAEHEAEYADMGLTKDYKLVDVRHILIMPQGATAETVTTETFSDEAWAWAENEAQTILDTWLAGEATEESFGALANAHSQDGTDTDGDGVGDTGGLYTEVYQGQMVTEFDAWCFDGVRQTGDYDIVKTVYGYHIMYFVGENYMWDDYAREDMITEQQNALIESAMAIYPVEAEYSAMVIADLNLAS